MADDPEKRGEPNLELPSLLGFRRKKKERDAAEPTQTAASDETADIEPVAPTDAEEPQAPPRPGPAPVEGSARRLPPTPPPAAAAEETAPVQASAPPAEPAVEPIPEPTPVEPTPGPTPVEPTPEPTPVEPEPVPTPVPPPPAPEPVEPTPEPQPAPVEQTTVLPEPVPGEPAQEPAAEAVGAPLFADEAETGRRRAPRERRPVTLPRINPRVAALVTGLLVGLVGVLLSFGASQGCEAVRGVGSCGGAGLFALLAVLAIEVVLGAILLKAWGIVDPTSTSFLGVGLVAVLALLFFLSSLDSVWMLLVIPLLTAIMFLVSWWVTETFIEQGADDNLHR